MINMIVHDDLQAFSELNKNVIVFPEIDLSYLCTKVNYMNASQDLEYTRTLISATNCTSTYSCSSLHRYPCTSIPNTCGSCLNGYEGVSGASNTLCYSIDELRKYQSRKLTTLCKSFMC